MQASASVHGGEGQRGYPVPFRESYEGGGLQSKYREMELGLAGVGEATPLATSRHASRNAAAQAAQRSQGKGSGQHYYYAPSTRLAEFTVAEHNARAAQAGHRLAEATSAGKIQAADQEQRRRERIGSPSARKDLEVLASPRDGASPPTLGYHGPSASLRRSCCVALMASFPRALSPL